MTITLEQTFYEPIPTGKYPAKINQIEVADGQFGPQLRFTFELPPGENSESRTLIGWCSQKFSNKSKLYGWTKAAFGGESIDRSYTFSSDDLVGKKVNLTVVEKENDDGVFNKIEGVTPFIVKENQTPPQSTSPPEFDGSEW